MIKISEKIIKEAIKTEEVELSVVKRDIQAGRTVVPKNDVRRVSKPCAIGKGLRTKVNANIGLSRGYSSVKKELEKMEAAFLAGADTVMDLSTGPLQEKLRRKILSECHLPVGTVPVYELACAGPGKFASTSQKDFIDVLEKQAAEGVDFFTVHAGITLSAVRTMSKKPRLINIVSRGGALLASWMLANGLENPFLSRYDDVVRIAKEYNVTLSLGDSLRPGSVADASDALQIQELLLLGELQKKTLEAGVQVMIEGPGHMPLDQIEANVKLEKTLCHGAPFYVLGPLVTDSAPGYDHIVSAIGGAVAGSFGADFLCYVTPAEHLKLPDAEDVRLGVMASRIAAHASDIVKGVPSAIGRDIEMSKARASRNWKRQFALALDGELPARMRKLSQPKEKDVCSMCADFCSMKMSERILDPKKRKGREWISRS